MALRWNEGTMTMEEDGTDTSQQSGAGYYTPATEWGRSEWVQGTDGANSDSWYNKILGSGADFPDVNAAITYGQSNPNFAAMWEAGLANGEIVPKADSNLWADTLRGGLQVGGAALGINSIFGSGLSGLFGGASGAGAEAATGVGSINPALAESFASTYAPSAWANTAGTLGGGAMDWNALTDGYGMGDYGGSSLEEMVSSLFDNAGTPGYTQYGDKATGLDWLKSQFGGPGSTTSNITKLLGGSSGNSSGNNTSTLSALAKLYSAYNSEGNLKNALGMQQGLLDKAVNYVDPNQSRGNEANRMWTENFTNPKAGYNEFMSGAGRDFTNQARAAAAKSGKRGSYLNSGKMQSDLSSLWMKNQFSRGDSLAKGFTNSRNTAQDALRDSLGLSDLYKQQGGSIGMAIGDLLGSSQARELISNITGSYW